MEFLTLGTWPNVSVIDSNGSAYRGNMRLEKRGDYYAFIWTKSRIKYRSFCPLRADIVLVYLDQIKTIEIKENGPYRVDMNLILVNNEEFPTLQFRNWGHIHAKNLIQFLIRSELILRANDVDNIFHVVVDLDYEAPRNIQNLEYIDCFSFCVEVYHLSKINQLSKARPPKHHKRRVHELDPNMCIQELREDIILSGLSSKIRPRAYLALLDIYPLGASLQVIETLNMTYLAAYKGDLNLHTYTASKLEHSDNYSLEDILSDVLSMFDSTRQERYALKRIMNLFSHALKLHVAGSSYEIGDTSFSDVTLYKAILYTALQNFRTSFMHFQYDRDRFYETVATIISNSYETLVENMYIRDLLRSSDVHSEYTSFMTNRDPKQLLPLFDFILASKESSLQWEHIFSAIFLIENGTRTELTLRNRHEAGFPDIGLIIPLANTLKKNSEVTK